MPRAAKSHPLGQKPGIENMPWFRDAFKERRCVVPAEAFYERANERWLRITPAGGELFLFAGIWEDPNAWTGDLPSYAFVTTEPNEVVAGVHDRMPVLLDPGSLADWVAPDAPIELLRALMKPCPAEWIGSIEASGPVS